MTRGHMRRRTSTRTLVGLDIEPGSIAVAQVATGGGLRVERSAAVALEPHVVRDGEVVDVEALTVALRDLWKAHRGLPKRVRIGLANARIVVRPLDAPPLENPSDLAAAVRFQAQEELPMPLEAAVLDFQALGLVDTPNGPRRRIVLVAARRDMVERFLVAARAAGLRPEGIDLSAFALVRALHDAESGPALLLSVGGVTNLAIVDAAGACVFTRVAGGGLEAIAADLAERHALTLEQSRAHLSDVGLVDAGAPAGADGDAAPAARAVLTEGVRRIAGEVRASLDFHHDQTPEAPRVEHIVLTGPALDVPGFADSLGAELGVAVEERTVAGASDHVADGHGLARVTVAAGLAVQEARP